MMDLGSIDDERRYQPCKRSKGYESGPPGKYSTKYGGPFRAGLLCAGTEEVYVYIHMEPSSNNQKSGTEVATRHHPACITLSTDRPDLGTFSYVVFFSSRTQKHALGYALVRKRSQHVSSIKLPRTGQAAESNRDSHNHFPNPT